MIDDQRRICITRQSMPEDFVSISDWLQRTQIASIKSLTIMRMPKKLYPQREAMLREYSGYDVWTHPGLIGWQQGDAVDQNSPD